MSRCAPSVARRRWVRHGLLALGWLSIALGIIGLVLPVVPTVPFLLLAAACFLRSSPRLYAWLVGHPRLGPPIRDYLEGRGIPLKGKIGALLLMWPSIALSCYLVPAPWMRGLVLGGAVLATVVILRQKTL